jgi:predicted metalloprotease with PDZ domain
MMLADVAIREQAKNKQGLQDALRAIRDQGTIADSWPLERVLRVGDAATGTRTLQELYSRMGSQPHEVDLATLWKRLGVARDGDSVSFDEAAPLAAIRKAIDGSPAAIPRP